MEPKPRRVSLKWKIGGTYTAVTLILGIFAVAGVYQLTKQALRDQLNQRVLSISSNLSDAAAGDMIGKNLLALHALARKYTLYDGVAYAVIEDRKGEILAHTLGRFPPELQQRPAGERQRQVERREVLWQGEPVYEAGVPILEGQMGRVRMGFWEEAIEKEIRHALLPIIGVVAIMPLLGALFAFFLAHWIVRPIVGLTEVADKVTMGNLEVSVSGESVKSRDEIGDLARSLERMRSSLRAAMLRLDRETV